MLGMADKESLVRFVNGTLGWAEEQQAITYLNK